GPELSQAEHAGVPLQIGCGRRGRYVQEGHDSVVMWSGLLRRHRRGALAAAFVAAAACAPSAANAPPPVAGATPSSRSEWADSVLATMSPRDKAAQLVWPQLFGDYAPTSSSGWTRVEQLITVEHVGGFIMSIGSPIETAVKLNAMQRLSR